MPHHTALTRGLVRLGTAALVVTTVSLGVVAAGSAPATAVPGGDVTVVFNEQVLAATTASMTVLCPAGQVALGGGAAPVGANPDEAFSQINISAPVDQLGGVATGGGVPAGWTAKFTTFTKPQLGRWRVFATCSPTADPIMASADLLPIQGSASVPCPAGRRAVGGGLTTLTPQLPVLYASGPNVTGFAFGMAPDGAVPTSWQVNMSVTSLDMRAVAICVSNSDATLRRADLDVPAMGGARAATVACPTGQRAVSGALAPVVDDNNMRLGFLAPVGSVGEIGTVATGSAPQSWTVQGHGYSVAVSYRAYAVCATAPRDTTPPDTTITKGPRKKSFKRKATFTFTSSEPGSTFTCTLDKRSAKPCTSPFTLKKLRFGRHKLTVTATDAAGNADPTPASYRWKVRKHKRHH